MPGRRRDSAKVKAAVKEILAEVVEEAETEATTERMPGQVVDAGLPTARKIPWTRRDLVAVFGEVTFTPEESVPITYNGITFHLRQDVAFTGPAVVKGIYEEYRRQKRQTPSFLMTDVGPVKIMPGAGGLSPDVTEES